jgi:hypothetical protein
VLDLRELKNQGERAPGPVQTSASGH